MSQRPSSPILFRLCWPVVWLAGLLAPAPERAEWRSLRRRHLWHWCAFLEESDRVTLANKLELSRYCWAAFPDALWRRLPRESTLKRLETALRSPQFFLGMCAAALLLVAIVSGLFATTRALLTRPAYDAPEQIATVASTGLYSPFRPGVPLRWVGVWREKSQTIQGVALYVWKAATISSPGQPPEPVLLGEVSTNFFPLLGGGVEMGRSFRDGDQQSCADCALLSYGTWKRLLPGEDNPVGKKITVDGRALRVLGILPRQFWFLSRADTIWTLLSEQDPMQIIAVPASGGGTINVALHNFRTTGAIVRLRPDTPPSAAAAELRNLAQTVTGPKIPAIEVVRLRVHAWQTFYPFGLAILAAIVLAASIGRFRFREPVGANRNSTPGRRWRMYFVAESLLLLAAAVLASVELTPWILRFSPGDPSAWLISAWICLALCLTALLWCLSDQQYRCRVCAYRLGMPLTVGNPLRVLLERGGTEMVCPKGHGLLHESAPTTWEQDSEQWTDFDSSWNSLFGDEEK